MIRRVTERHGGQLAFAHDVFMASIAFPVALYLRLGDSFWEHPLELVALNTLLFAVSSAVVFRVMGLYRGVWRYASLNDLVAITKAVTLDILVFLPVTFVTTRLDQMPRSILIIHWLVLMVLLGAPRFLYRLFKDGQLDMLRRTDELPRIPVLLVGAGDGAELFVRAMMHRPGATYRVVGLVDPNPNRVGYQLHGVEVLGTLSNLKAVVERLEDRGQRPQRLVLTDDGLDGAVVRALLEQADAIGVALSRLPKLTEFKQGAVDDRLQVRPIAIEDLLNRPQTVLDRDGMRALIGGKRVLVTGAGGSIGSELVRQISDYGPSRLVMVDNSEYHLYEIDMEMAGRHPGLVRCPVLCDVRDRARIDAVFAEQQPELVFHAAALKHVPMVEANITEGVLTNVSGSRNVADACQAAGVTAMVMISTDKAVNPSSVMGATKRIAESYCQSLDLLDRQRPGATRFVTVRFGNVLGSTGSVVPLFQKQLAKGGPLTVTHPDIERYFMTIREAVELVLQAAVLGVSDQDDRGKLFVLDMGDPVKIVDLAKQMIRLAGLRPGEDVEIAFTGLRPGEKLTEELFHDAEPLVPTSVKGIRLASPRTADHKILVRALDGLIEVARQGQSDDALDRIRSLVPEYARNVTPVPASRRSSSLPPA
jgi:FlaA1/EpsC-like NDP-sugar epimerase